METNRSAILHFWQNGERSPAAISRMTKISIQTGNYNIKKIKEQGTIEDRPRKGRPRKITGTDNIALGQWIRRDNESTSKQLVHKLLYERDLSVSVWTVRRQLERLGYTSILPRGTPMLTQQHKNARVQ